jgi:putative MFS transporter
MAQEASGAGAAGGVTLVIPGEMAARIDRLPLSRMIWVICLTVQIGWATSASTDGIASRLYPFIWIPNHAPITHFDYSVLYALQTGISILLGGYALGWLADKIGRRNALILSSLLAGVFIWPFAYVTNYPALFFLSIADTLGFAGFLAINVVYLSEIMSPTVRTKTILVGQVLNIVLLAVVLTGIIPHYMFPGQYRAYLWILAGLNLLVALALFLLMPESPRWLEARERRDQARTIVERLEAQARKRHPVLPEPDLAPHQVVAEEKTSPFAVFFKPYLLITVFLLVVMVLGYGGIIYGNGGYAFLFLAETRGYSASFSFALSAWAGACTAAVYLVNALLSNRIERKYIQLAGAILFAICWLVMYNVHSTPGVYALYIGQTIGLYLWLWSMYLIIPPNYPTRMRSLGTGWTDGVGHLGAWGGVLLAGVVFSAAAPLGWILLITIPGALVPGFMVAIFTKNQRHRALEELAR